MRQGTFQWMKSVNKSIILNKIRTSAPISRAQIAKDTKLTPPTVSNNVKELIEQGFVKESELGESQGGRKPTMLLINQTSFYIIGVDVGPTKIKSILTDMMGKVMVRQSRDLITPTTNEQFLTLLKESVQGIVNESQSKMNKVIGIGVAMHGVVDIETGMSLFAPNIGLTNIPIKEELEKAFELDVIVENDARAMALGESWFGDHGKLDSMMAINIGRGVGAGLVSDGALFHGANDIAGEVGHMTIDLQGTLCECGNRGCFQTLTTGVAIAEKARTEIEKNPSLPVSGETVYQLAKSGNTACIKILEEVGYVIGVGLTNLIHILNPDKIVLGGGVVKSEEFILPFVIKAVEERVLTPQAKKTVVVVSELGDDATLIGAVSLLLVDLFSPN